MSSGVHSNTTNVYFQIPTFVGDFSLIYLYLSSDSAGTFTPYYLYLHPPDTSTDNWWDSRWAYRRHIANVVPSGGPYESGIHFLHIELDLDSLVSEEKLRADYQDLRIIFTSGSYHINVPYYIASGCSPQKIYFPAQNYIPSGVYLTDYDWKYYVYYGNPSGNIEQLPPPYKNYNFPQAPYSPTITWEQPFGRPTESGFRDKFLYRLNDDPSIGDYSSFEDSTGFTSGIANVDGAISKGHPGRLDRCVYFSGIYNGSLRIDYTNNITHPSGSFAFDCWLKPDYGGTKYIFTRYRDNNSSYLLRLYCSYDDLYGYYYYNYSSYLYVRKLNELKKDAWTHIRFAYRTNLSDGSKFTLYINGQPVVTGTQGIATALYGDELGLTLLGGLNNSSYIYKGYMEQARFSVYPEFASGVMDYDVPPDWVDTEYILHVGPEVTYYGELPYYNNYYGGVCLSAMGRPWDSGLFGGLYLGEKEYERADFGGYIISLSTLETLFGGFTFSFRGTEEGRFGGAYWSWGDEHLFFYDGGVYVAGDISDTFLGGYLNALDTILRTTECGGYLPSVSGIYNINFGGFTVATWYDYDNSIVECLDRTLIKANSDFAYQQEFYSDAEFNFYAINNNDFDATLLANIVTNDEFDSHIVIDRIRKNPYIKIIDIVVSGLHVTVTASGYAFDVNNQAISSGIRRVDFVWSDGDSDSFVTTDNIWQLQHYYSSSGIYCPIVIGYDKYGRRGSDSQKVNLLPSGYTDYPYINLSGIPREGLVPPSLLVDFSVSLSGINYPYTLYWDFGNGVTQYNNSLNLVAQYVLPGDYIPYVRIEDARKIPVIDTLRIGYNK